MTNADDKKRVTLVAACKRAIERASRGEVATHAIAEDLRFALDAGNEGTGEMRVVELRDCALQTFEAQRARWDDADPVEPTLLTGLHMLDAASGVLECGSLLVVNGPEESGRTALVLRIAHEVSRLGHSVVFVTHREPAQALAHRVILGCGAFDDDPNTRCERWEALVRATDDLMQASMTVVSVDRAAGAPLRQVLAVLDERRIADEPPPTLLVVDDVDDAHEGSFVALRTLKRWARRHGSAVVAVTRRTESLFAHGPLEPDSVLRLARSEPNLIAMRCGRGAGRSELRGGLVFSDARGWFDFDASNERHAAEGEAARAGWEQVFAEERRRAASGMPFAPDDRCDQDVRGDPIDGRDPEELEQRAASLLEVEIAAEGAR